MNSSDLKNSQQWWFGPEFLKKAKEEWPEVKIKRESNAETYNEMTVEARKQESMPMKEQFSSFITTKQEEQHAKRLDSSRYSKWYRINDDIKLEFGLSLLRLR